MAQIISTLPGGATQTAVMDYSEVAKNVEVTTSRMDSPGKMTFTCMENGSIGIPEGSSVEFAVDGFKMFKGYVFIIERK